MTNSNISAINVRQLGLGPVGQRGEGGGRGLGSLGSGGDIISAIIQQKTAGGTILQLSDGSALNASGAAIQGEVGDSVFFELVQSEENAQTLRQIFPNIAGQEFLTKQISLANLEELMKKKGYVQISDGQMDITSDMKERVEERARANEVAGRMKRSLGRISGSVHSAAVAQLAAEGINIDKIPVHVLSGVVGELETAKAVHETKVYDELTQKIAGVNSISDGQITQMLGNEAPLTLDNLYVYKNSTAELSSGYLSAEDLKGLKTAIDRFFTDNGIEKTPENLAKVHLLLDNQVPLTPENFDKFIFLQDIETNTDINKLLSHAVALDAAGEGIGGLDIYNPKPYEDKTLVNLKDAIYKHEARLAMSYEASAALFDTNIEIDLKPQIESLNALKAQEAEILTVLKELKLETAEASQKMADAFKSFHTLPYANMALMGAVAQEVLEFTPAKLEQHIVSRKYDEGATVVSLKYGDTAAKIAQQFAPMLESLGLDADADSVRAAKILTANNMELNANNLAKIKDIDAKLADIQKYMHPRIAAAMVAEGLSPAEMHVDDILAFVEKHKEQYGISSHEQLLKHIHQMDREGDISPEMRAQIMEIYQALYKIMKHGGAGVGHAVNAGIEFTLQGLMDFSKIYNTNRGKNNTINYTAEDGAYYAKHVVTSFADAAAPAPLAEFAQNESFNEPMPKAAEKMQDYAKKAEVQELDTKQINDAIAELSGGTKEPLRVLTMLGLPVTLQNLRSLQNVKDKKLEETINELDNEGEVLSILPKSELEGVSATNEALTDQIEVMMEQAMDKGDTDSIKKIDQIEIALQSLSFRQRMAESGLDHSFFMNFNGRMTDVTLHLLSSEMSVEAGVTTYLTLSTAMGPVEGLLHIKGEEITLTLSAETEALKLMEENRQMLPENFNIIFKDKTAMKNHLSLTNNLPIY
ncbi:MAG: DUF6240 domain-containing protein [Defluviitaleaceae bacterium]|nr:DUF6240 domain-containing protein [Defluviitaleaceae bacterium]